MTIFHDSGIQAKRSQVLVDMTKDFIKFIDLFLVLSFLTEDKNNVSISLRSDSAILDELSHAISFGFKHSKYRSILVNVLQAYGASDLNENSEVTLEAGRMNALLCRPAHRTRLSVWRRQHSKRHHHSLAHRLHGSWA